jgi:gamma-glutamyltranspeptidase/glutathione hydrolase
MVSIKIFTLPFVIFNNHQIYCRFKIYNIFCVSLLILSFSCGTKKSSPPKYIKVSQAGVACADILASKVGIDILQKGGNAADAATAVAMSLAVVYPQAGNLGGGGFILSRRNSGEVIALDFRETAPAAATADMYLNEDGTLNSEKSQVGARAVGVPGTVRGFYQFHKKYGNLDWSTVLSPAIRLAGEGFILSEFQCHVLNQYKRYFEKFASSKAIFLSDGDSWQPGEKFVQKDLSKSLKLVAEFGDSAFYEGEIATEIVRSVNKKGGILSLEDFKKYRAVPREPIVISYYDYVIYAMPPPTSGGVVLAGILQSLQEIDVEKYPLHSSQQIALLSELEKHYFALRNEFLSDPDFVDIPIQWLLSSALSNEILALVSIGSPMKSDKIVQK